MDELRERFAAIDRIAAPDLWTEIERRSDALGALESTSTVERARPALRTPPGIGPRPAWGGRQLIVVLIVIAALVAALIGALIGGSPRPHDIRTVVVPSLAAQAPAPTASSVQSPTPGAASWTPSGPMEAAAYLQTATILGDGSVLITGGRYDARTDKRSLGIAELFDPGTTTSTKIANLVSGRSAHTATRLTDGRVLLAGGFDDWAGLATVEIYDPRTRGWTPTGSMIEGRGYHTATLLPDGRVLVTGGRSNNSSTGHALSSAELYDPTTGTWTLTASMSRGRASHTATALPDGRVLVAGAGIAGVRVDVADTAELYDPATGTWAPTGSMTLPRAGHGAVLLPTGKVLVVGGNDSTADWYQAGSGLALASAELYDPATGSWTATGSMHVPHALSTTTVLTNGEVIVAGGRVGGQGASSGTSSYDTGRGSSRADLYDPTTGAWTETARLGQRRELHTAVALPDGRVLVVGGLTAGQPLGTTEIYDPGAGR